MFSRQSWITLVILASFLIFLPTLSSQTTFSISIDYNGGTCKQNGSTGVIDVDLGSDVRYQSSTAVSYFQVQFATCAFSNCPVTSPTGAPTDAGVPPSAGTFYYSTVTIGNQTCNNPPGSFGLHVKPGPIMK